MTEQLQNMSNALRALAMDAVEAAKSGHPGMPMGFADVATILWGEFLKYDAADPDWHDRDRFVLSAGHGSMLLYGLLYLSGYEDMTLDQIKNFRQLGSACAGHPEYGHSAGIETTTGPLGQGLANAVGMALAERNLNAEFGDALVNHKTYAVVGDGCLMEGISQEAISLAGHLRLKNLIVLFDDNNISIDGTIDLSDSTDQSARFAASGWHCLSCDGHDFADIRKILTEAQASDAPCFIACRTTIGYGAPNKSNSAAAHGAPLGAEEVQAARKQLGWQAEPFDIPEDILKEWRSVGNRHAETRTAWQEALQQHPKKQAFTERMQRQIPSAANVAVEALKKSLTAEAEDFAQASRVSSQKLLDVLTPEVPAMIGGSADLTGSNNTKAEGQQILNADNYGGRYIHYGIRELGMAAVMNGLALHGGIIPYGGTFLVFSDYARSAIRLSALMGVPVIYVMTHDSIGLGEDGPTHQPVEHLAALRAIPNLAIYRPADAVETAEAWQLALADAERPSLLALTRQNLPLLRRDIGDNLTAKGGYVLHDEAKADVTLVASGSEVSIAYEAVQLLAERKVKARLVSMPCMELFIGQGDKYCDKVLGEAPRVFVEAAISDSYYRFMRAEDNFIGMRGFGASAPAGDLYKHFGITAEAIVGQVA